MAYRVTDWHLERQITLMDNGGISGLGVGSCCLEGTRFFSFSSLLLFLQNTTHPS